MILEVGKMRGDHKRNVWALLPTHPWPGKNWVVVHVAHSYANAQEWITAHRKELEVKHEQRA